jgi:hypothetical protein
MSGKRKWIIVSIVGTAAILLFGTIGGMVYAQTTASPTPPAARVNPQKVLADKVAAILKLDNTTVENAFTAAQAEIQQERATAQLKQMEARIDQMATDGKLTPDQAAKMKTWIESKPNVPVPGFDMFGGPGGPPRGHGGPGGPPRGPGGPMMGPGGFGGPPMMGPGGPGGQGRVPPPTPPVTQ